MVPDCGVAAMVTGFVVPSTAPPHAAYVPAVPVPESGAQSNSTVISLCNLAVTSASGGVPNVNTFTLAFGTCGSSPTEIENISGVTGYTDQFFGSLAGTAGQAFCMKEATANSDKVFASFLQK